MTQHLSADDAAARLRPTDSLGMPLGPGQPPAFLEALGRRTDWEHLRIGGALLTVLSDVFSHPNVHYLSGFFGPLERLLRDSGANLGFAPADFRRFGPILAADPPRVMTTAAAPPDADGWISLSLHAGATVAELHAAAADPDRLLVVEVSPHFPRTYGLGDERHAFHLDAVDILVESDREPVAIDDPPANDVDRAIAEHVRAYVPDGATLQTGIGAVPSAVAGLLAEGGGGDYGVHSEMFTTGLMRLHQAGKVTNARKGTFDGVSVSTFAGGTRALYDWLHENRDVAFLPVDVVNSPEAIARNRCMVTINAAMAVDIQGQVVADTISAVQYSGIGGHEDFVAGPALSLEDRSLLCLPSTLTRGDQLHSRIVPWFDAGAVITTPRHQVDVIVTEFGAAELQGKTVHQRGLALAAIAHPAFREGLREAAERASHGRAPFPPPLP
ncbi:MAG: acetyl-CoA hydrolase/transferase family protein [Acidimicrobiales bacterium]